MLIIKNNPINKDFTHEWIKNWLSFAGIIYRKGFNGNTNMTSKNTLTV